MLKLFDKYAKNILLLCMGLNMFAVGWSITSWQWYHWLNVITAILTGAAAYKRMLKEHNP